MYVGGMFIIHCVVWQMLDVLLLNPYSCRQPSSSHMPRMSASLSLSVYLCRCHCVHVCLFLDVPFRRNDIGKLSFSCAAPLGFIVSCNLTFIHLIGFTATIVFKPIVNT